MPTLLLSGGHFCMREQSCLYGSGTSSLEFPPPTYRAEAISAKMFYIHTKCHLHSKSNDESLILESKKRSTHQFIEEWSTLPIQSWSILCWRILSNSLKTFLCQQHFQWQIFIPDCACIKPETVFGFFNILKLILFLYLELFLIFWWLAFLLRSPFEILYEKWFPNGIK